MSKIDELIAEFCPDGVSSIQLDEVAKFSRGQTITKNTSEYGRVPVIGGGQKPAYWHSVSNRDCGAITVSGSGAYSGFVSRWDVPIWVSDGFSVDPIENLADGNYIFHVLKAKQAELFNLQRGGGVPHVYSKDVAKMTMQLPPLDVQREIVSILDKFTQLEAELEAELEARRVQLRELTELLIDSAESHGQELAFGDLAQVLRGSSPRPIEKYMSDNPEDLPWIKIGDVSSNSKFVTRTRQRVSAEGASKSRLINPGDFILSNSMSFGRPYISKIRGCIHDGWLMISDFQDSFNPDYLYYLLGSNRVQEQFRAQAGTGTVKNLNAEIVKRLKLRVPPMEMQARIASVLDSFEELVSDSDCSIPREIAARRKQFDHYRNKLLTFKELETA